ncbi:MAG: hypothetical protein ABSB42_14105 [Tepidisphaeraceae bacterium]|jgi:hypothetical protein
MNHTGARKIMTATKSDISEIASWPWNQYLKPAPIAKVATNHNANHAVTVHPICRWQSRFAVMNSLFVMTLVKRMIPGHERL